MPYQVYRVAWEKSPWHKTIKFTDLTAPSNNFINLVTPLQRRIASVIVQIQAHPSGQLPVPHRQSAIPDCQPRSNQHHRIPSHTAHIPIPPSHIKRHQTPPHAFTNRSPCPTTFPTTTPPHAFPFPFPFSFSLSFPSYTILYDTFLYLPYLTILHHILLYITY